MTSALLAAHAVREAPPSPIPEREAILRSTTICPSCKAGINEPCYRNTGTNQGVDLKRSHWQRRDAHRKHEIDADMKDR
jgi:hypothetical protein